jgi:hypothetical protein
VGICLIIFKYLHFISIIWIKYNYFLLIQIINKRGIFMCLKCPLASVGYPDSCTVNCNHKINIVCLNATVEIGFQTVDSFALAAITRMVWQGLSSSLYYPLGLPIRQMKIYSHVTNSKNKSIRIKEFSSFLAFIHFCQHHAHSSIKP